MLSACATFSNAPSEAGSVSFGERPENYKEIVKTYMEKRKKGTKLDLDKVHFLNEPNKYVYERLTQEKFGYRVCALIPVPALNKLRSHFFLINDGKVIKHLYDSGLVSLSRKFCDTEMLALETKVKAAPVTAAPVATPPVDEHGFKYISCEVRDNEIFFAFSPEKQKLLQQSDGKQIAEFDIQQLSETFIVATTADIRVSINRISGTIKHQTKGVESKGHCELTSKQRF